MPCPSLEPSLFLAATLTRGTNTALPAISAVPGNSATRYKHRSTSYRRSTRHQRHSLAAPNRRLSGRPRRLSGRPCRPGRPRRHWPTVPPLPTRTTVLLRPMPLLTRLQLKSMQLSSSQLSSRQLSSSQLSSLQLGRHRSSAAHPRSSAARPCSSAARPHSSSAARSWACYPARPLHSRARPCRSWACRLARACRS